MNKIIKIVNILILVILIPILIISLLFIAKSYMDKDEVPSVLGYSPLIVLSGSMESEIYTGDLVIVKKSEIKDLKAGDVIAFYTDNTKSTTITHRIVEIEKEGSKTSFITKGDNNDTRDVGKVDSSLVVGKYLGLRFKGIGNAAVFLQTPTGMCIVISIPVLILFISQYLQNRRSKKELEEIIKQQQIQKQAQEKK